MASALLRTLVVAAAFACVTRAADAQRAPARVWNRGSPASEVASIQGQPDFVERLASLRFEAWHYGESWIRFSYDDRRAIAWHNAGNLKIANDSGMRADTLAQLRHDSSRPHAPASLLATLAFSDDGDGILDAEERATITLTVRNVGAGAARNIAPVITTAPPRVVTVISSTRVDSLSPHGTTIITCVIAASAALIDGSARMTIALSEANGFDLAPPATLVVATRALRAPHMVLDDITIADQSGNGRIEPREIVDVTARIANRGHGTARDVRATIAPGNNIFLVPGTATNVSIGVLRPGDVRDIHFSAFANSRADGFPVSFAIRESRLRFDTTISLGLALDRAIATTPSLVVRGRDWESRDTPAPLVVDVDTGVPRGVTRNTVAVVLGVERYQHAPAAPFAKRDAAVFREYAEQLFGARDDQLLFRTDDEVSGGELRKVFGDGGWLARRVTPATDVVVYFAGHGVADLHTHAPYLLPNDADPNYPVQTGLALNELYERLALLHAHSVAVFIDACFSGNTRDGTTLFRGAREVVVSVEHPALRSATMAVFTASASDELANIAADRQHGLFTYWLLRGLRGDADSDADRRISVGELERFLAARVPGDAARQDREQHPSTVARDRTRVLAERR